MSSDTTKIIKKWEDLARAADHETDPAKLAKIIKAMSAVFEASDQSTSGPHAQQLHVHLGPFDAAQDGELWSSAERLGEAVRATHRRD